MGEARRRTKVDRTTVEVGPRLFLENDKVVERPAERISIEDLEDYARAFLGRYPEPFHSAEVFVYATVMRETPSGRYRPVRELVHPDRRVQRVLEMLRGAPQVAPWPDR